MSNWCENYIRIETEDNVLIKRISDGMKSDLFCFDFSKVIPMPDDVENCREWMQRNWGTNNLYSAEYCGDGEWYVTTANCPPCKVLEELSRKYHCTVSCEFHAVHLDDEGVSHCFKCIDGEFIESSSASSNKRRRQKKWIKDKKWNKKNAELTREAMKLLKLMKR